MSRPDVLREAAELALERASSLEREGPAPIRRWWCRGRETTVGAPAALRTFAADLRTRADAVESGERKMNPWYRAE